jgi:hypothetical protein
MANGNRVVFQSNVSLTPNDLNNKADVYLVSRYGSIHLISTSYTGLSATHPCTNPRISGNGQSIVFTSMSYNLDPHMQGYPSSTQVYLWNNWPIRLVSHKNGDFLRACNGGCTVSDISSDGRYVVFDSTATDLVANDTNSLADVFVYDATTGLVTRVSVASDGTQGNQMSALGTISSDGTYVAFQSYATNLVANDTNNKMDIFVHSLSSGETTRVSVDSGEAQANHNSLTPSISFDGRHVAFASYASNLVTGDTNSMPDIFVRDCVAGTTERVSLTDQGGQTTGVSCLNQNPSITGDGTKVAFESNSLNVVADKGNGYVYDVYVRDRTAQITERVNVSFGEDEANSHSGGSVISSGGDYVTFHSYATNLVPDDTNGQADVFITGVWQWGYQFLGPYPQYTYNTPEGEDVDPLNVYFAGTADDGYWGSAEGVDVSLNARTSFFDPVAGDTQHAYFSNISGGEWRSQAHQLADAALWGPRYHVRLFQNPYPAFCGLAEKNCFGDIHHEDFNHDINMHWETAEDNVCSEWDDDWETFYTYPDYLKNHEAGSYRGWYTDGKMTMCLLYL